ncbi:MAG: hypothetical protein VYB00_04535 [Candidatus Thermoplasmatota archaeon]|nr:hypothetical protein [Candidatus Thermoplasmatota archaeon]MED5268069.1 hypothetical protein [Candidatus Thermoplasmatota archaeon]|tara:strand:- start:832 stop:960 length:129 start_codon:yes stop_codon:yes gene_type:complete
MNPKTLKGQRKIRTTSKKIRGKKVAEKKIDASCNDPGCGCGN